MGANRELSESSPAALDAKRITEHLGRDSSKLPLIRIEPEVDSTNTRLARLRAAGEPVEALLAESQSAGRGRRGRHWISPPGCGVYLSMFRAFAGPVRRLEALGLVAGLAGAAAIERCCGVRPGLKWPNDIQIDGRKVAGCLIDLGGAPEATQAIIGVGINVDFGDRPGPDQPWTDLASATGQAPDRNRLAAALIDQLTDDLDRFDEHGFGELQARWALRDVLRGREVEACGPQNAIIQGRVLGVDESGRLLLQTPDELHRLHSGEVTLKISR
jgi:BirA family biotin operon repressor/biotin-[acetyl-CoA-carboxylase] ligase